LGKVKTGELYVGFIIPYNIQSKLNMNKLGVGELNRNPGRWAVNLRFVGLCYFIEEFL